MAGSMWEWFDDTSVNAANGALRETMRTMASTDQMDPAEVVSRMVELVESDTTTENNFVPPTII
jgi:hypothetical protein